MLNTVVVGAQWGDEGKAKITDLLANEADIIIRWQGGCNAGHTVVVNNKTYKFHLVPSGVLYKNKICIIGAGTVIHPDSLENEINTLIADGVNLSGLKIHPLASITMPYHIDIDGISEQNASKNSKIGTTKKGIGPTYTDKIGRFGLKIQDLYDEEFLSTRLDTILEIKNPMLKEIYKTKEYSKEDLMSYCKKYAEFFKPYVFEDWQSYYETIKKENKTVLFEGAQGIMLDIDWGTYPYVTSSNPIGGGAAVGTGLGVKMIDDIIGISKAYITRVGEGPFVTELTNEIGKSIQTIGHEFGTTTGRARRCGWFDAVVARYGVQVAGLTSMAITKLDVFDNFEEIKVCIAYKDTRNNTEYKYYPTNINIHKYLEPVYQTFAGWKTPITEVKTYEDLPKNAKLYIEAIEEMIGIPVSIISVGADREQTIFRN